MPKGEAAAFAAAHDYSGDQEAADGEEHIDAKIAARQPRHFGVEQDRRRNRDGAKSVYLGTIGGIA